MPETPLTKAQIDDLRRLSAKPVPLDKLAHEGRWSLSVPDAALYDMPEYLQELVVGMPVAVRGFGAWRHGRVLALGRSLAVVAFVTPSNLTKVHKPANPLAAIRKPTPAQAAFLEQVR